MSALFDNSGRRASFASFGEMPGCEEGFAAFLEEQREKNPALILERFKPIHERLGEFIEEAKLQDLRNLDLSGQTVTWLDLQGSDFQGSSFEGARLNAVCLRMSLLPEVNFRKATLCVGLNNACLPGADFRNARIEFVNFDFADLPAARFEESQIEKGRFACPNLQTARFDRARVTAVFRGWRQGGAGQRAQIADVSFKDADLAGCEFIDADLCRIDFTGAKIVRTKFENCSFDEVNLCNAVLDDIKVERCQNTPALLCPFISDGE